MKQKTKPFLSEIFLPMETIVKNNVKAYINDFYEHDIIAMQKAKKGTKYLWIVRSFGTSLIRKDDIAHSNEVAFYINNKDILEQSILFFEVDNINYEPIPVLNIKEYYKNTCKEKENIF